MKHQNGLNSKMNIINDEIIEIDIVHKIDNINNETILEQQKELDLLKAELKHLNTCMCIESQVKNDCKLYSSKCKKCEFNWFDDKIDENSNNCYHKNKYIQDEYIVDLGDFNNEKIF